MGRSLSIETLDDYLRPYSSRRPKAYICVCLTHPRNTEMLRRCKELVVSELRLAGFDVHDPSEHTQPGSPHYAREVFALDFLSVASADLVFFIRVDSSIGVGIEAQIAANLLIPYCQLLPNECVEGTTPLLLGLANRSCGINNTFRFDLNQLRDDLRRALASNELQTQAVQATRYRQRLLSLIEATSPGVQIRTQRLLQDIPLHELADRTGVQPELLLGLERNSAYYAGAPLAHVLRVTEACGLNFRSVHSDTQLAWPALQRQVRVRREVAEAACEFAKYSLTHRCGGEPDSEDDAHMMSHWKIWLNSKGLVLPKQTSYTQPRIAHSTDLRAMLLLPMSGIEESKEEIDQVASQITSAVSSMPYWSVVDPREDHPKTRAPIIRRELGEDIYAEQVRRLVTCDFVVAILYPPPTGVGILSMVATGLTMQQFGVIRTGRDASRMYSGLIDSTFHGSLIRYTQPSDVGPKIRDRMSAEAGRLSRSAAIRKAVITKILSAKPLRAIHEHCIRSQIPLRELVSGLVSGPQSPAGRPHEGREETLIQSCWLEHATRMPELGAVITPIQLLHIADAMQCQIMARNGVPALCFPSACTDSIVTQSLDNLIQVCEEGNWTEPESRIHQLWEAASPGLRENVKRGDARRAISCQEWKEALFPRSLLDGTA